MAEIRHIKTQAQKDEYAAMTALKKQNQGVQVDTLTEQEREYLLSRLLIERFGLIE